MIWRKLAYGVSVGMCLWGALMFVSVAADMLRDATTDECLYTYRALVVDVYDGDTVTADIDLGLNTWRRGEKLRLYGIDAPEVRGATREAGLVSRDWLRERVLSREVTVRTIKDSKGKYGRILAVVWDAKGDINADLVALGLADAREY